MKLFAIFFLILANLAVAASHECTMEENALSGRDEAWIIPSLVPAAEIKGLIPSKLKLGTPMTPDDRHLILFLVGKHLDVTSEMMPGELNYDVFIVMMPGLIGKSDNVAYNHFPQLNLNDVPAILAGIPFGFPKHFNQFLALPNQVKIKNATGTKPLATASFEPKGDFIAADQHPAHPLMAQALSNLNMQKTNFGKFVRFRIDTGITSGRFYLRPSAARLHFERGFLPWLKARDFEVPALSETSLGAFELKAEWCFSRPEYIF